MLLTILRASLDEAVLVRRGLSRAAETAASTRNTESLRNLTNRKGRALT
jgi:hypothetical protein